MGRIDYCEVRDKEDSKLLSSSHSQSEDKSINNGTICILDDQFCWQIGVLIVEFWLMYSILNSSQINRLESDKKGEIK